MEECQSCKDLIDYHEIVDCITYALDAKDSYTAGHSQRVSDMCVIVCRLLGMAETDCEKIHIAAHLHDIGKIGVPDAVLKKEGRLTDEEFEEIKKHSVIGAEILAHSKRLSELCDLVRHHHERYDGRGYPDKLTAEDIPYGARIIAVCDSIDAMTSNRCYRKAFDFDYCRSEIERNRGLMYDPHITDVVLENWEKVIGVVTKKVIS